MLKIKGLLVFVALLAFVATPSHAKRAYSHSNGLKAYTIHKASDTVLHNSGAVHHRKHKFIAAILALPLGVFGLHRVYLGTSPGVPFVYIATFGGGLGILPFVDFVIILLCKDINTYAYNPRLFMWSKDKN